MTTNSGEYDLVPSNLDPRAVANLILSLVYKPSSNLELQKLLYFVHGVYLIKTKKPLVSGYFEAWTHGPVHPAVYSAFKEYGAEAITTPALKKNLRTGKLELIDLPTDREVIKTVRSTVDSFSDLTPGQLVRLSHARDGPWDEVYKRSQTHQMLGLRISNELITEKFRYHRITACKLDQVEEPREDTPLTYYRLG